ncbi:MAG: penicillin acylase family protein, partial [Marinobacterium sp.]|nr:penicillin acylase family protein [Marinobacterium sp.]
VRDTSFDWSKPVDGSNPATEWGRLHTVEETVGVLNPATGWLQNTNNTPYSVIGDASPKVEDYPAYMATFPENYRGINAVRVLKDKKDFTLETLAAAAYDPYLAAFEVLLPPLFADYEALSTDDPQRAALAEQIEMLKNWDLNASTSSVPTTLAAVWADQVWRAAFADKAGVASYRARGITRAAYIAEVADVRGLELFAATIAKLEADFGSWRTPWGKVNVFQRISPA